MLGLYIHVPFCSAICNYCNFNRGLFDTEQKRRYVEALVTEIEAANPRHVPGGTSSIPTVSNLHGRRDPSLAADTVYFGGGTPSLLEPEEIARVIETLAAAFDLAADREVTLEANPESVTADRLVAYRQAGVNRVSFGVQSFHDEELQRLSRLHSAARARAALSETRRAGFDNISLDLMMWLPGQRVEEWLDSVDQAIVLAPEHLSLYLLEVYPNAPLKEAMARAHWSQAPDDDAAAMYIEAMERLEACGYEQYEISNLARPGRRSRHNLKYWSDGEWLGFGCGAHSTRDGVRWKNVSSLEEYIDRVSRRESTAIDVRRLTGDERLGDALFTGLRLADGLDVSAIRARYDVDVWERYGRELEPFVQLGLLGRDGSRLWLTRPGMLLAHEVMTVFV